MGMVALSEQQKPADPVDPAYHQLKIDPLLLAQFSKDDLQIMLTALVEYDALCFQRGLMMDLRDRTMKVIATIKLMLGAK